MHKYSIFFFFLLHFIFLGTSFSQSQYTMRITNGRMIDDYTYQYDVVLSSQNYFEITSYQCVFSFYCNDMNNDSFNFSYISGSSQLQNKPILGFSARQLNNKVELTVASKAQSDYLDKNILKVGTFQVKRQNKKFDYSSIFINWNFSGDNTTIVTGHLFSDITIPSDFTSDIKLTGIKNSETRVPDNYELEQNYPNPFNPSTKIEFFLKQSGKVKLYVYNLIGQKVAELINEELPTGFHNVNFNASDLASGIYIYQLKVDNKFTSAKKMILAK